MGRCQALQIRHPSASRTEYCMRIKYNAQQRFCRLLHNGGWPDPPYGILPRRDSSPSPKMVKGLYGNYERPTGCTTPVWARELLLTWSTIADRSSTINDPQTSLTNPGVKFLPTPINGEHSYYEGYDLY